MRTPPLTSLVLAATMLTLGCSDEGTPPATTNIAKLSGDEQAAVGTYQYYCSLHATAASTSGMIGRIVIR